MPTAERGPVNGERFLTSKNDHITAAIAPGSA